MTKRDDSTFLKGAFVLTGAGILVKLIGALNRIPLYSILGDEGMGLYQMAYPIYTILLTVSSSGLNVAISKVVAERWALGKRVQAADAFRVALALMAVLGLASTLILYFSADWIADNMAHDPRAAISIRALSPALFTVAVLSAFRGWFQGIEKMEVPALTQVVEQVGRLVTMLFLANMLLPRGLEVAAAGATLGASVGAFVAAMWALAAYFRGPRPWLNERRRVEASDFWSDTTKRIITIAAPISLASAIFGITEIVDLAIVPGRLQSIGLETQEATRQFGRLAAGAFPLLNLPTLFTSALQMALVPSISAAMALGDRDAVRRRVMKALSLTLALAVPAAIGLYVLAEPIPTLLYSQPEVAPILRTLTPAVVFLALQQVTAGVLHGLGRLRAPLVNLAWAVGIKAVVTYVLVGTPSLGILGAGIATSVHFGIAGLLNLRAVMRDTGPVLNWRDLLKLPLAGGAMAVAAVLAYSRLSVLVSWKVATLAAVGVGAVVYGVFALLLGIVRSEDLAAFPLLGRFFGKPEK